MENMDKNCRGIRNDMGRLDVKTFIKGGIHPPEHKITDSSPIEELPLPEQVIIPLSQHIGVPSKIAVKKGESVKTGQLLADQVGNISTCIHSSVSGKVKKVTNYLDASGYHRQAVLIQVEGDEWLEEIDKSDTLNQEITLSSREILQRISRSGIVGLGGATFPSHVKLTIPEAKQVDTLLINAAECEPYLTADHRLMLKKGPEIVVGAKVLMKVLGIERTIIGVEANKKDAIAHLKQLVEDETGEITVCPLQTRYPQGGEKQLIKAVLNREVPPGKFPLDVGAVVHNVGTVFAVYEAIQKNKPLFERVVTLTGPKVSKPGNYLVRIGTPISFLIEHAGGLPDDTGKVISGGPMMGKALTSLDVPVVKGTSGVLLLPQKASRRSLERPCIRCANCIQVCPMGLSPFVIAAHSKRYHWDDIEKLKALSCIECGSCSYICPAAIPILDWIRIGKVNLAKIKRKQMQLEKKNSDAAVQAK
jgi:electron transport complex protein RnfC